MCARLAYCHGNPIGCSLELDLPHGIDAEQVADAVFQGQQDEEVHFDLDPVGVPSMCLAMFSRNMELPELHIST